MLTFTVKDLTRTPRLDGSFSLLYFLEICARADAHQIKLIDIWYLVELIFGGILLSADAKLFFSRDFLGEFLVWLLSKCRPGFGVGTNLWFVDKGDASHPASGHYLKQWIWKNNLTKDLLFRQRWEPSDCLLFKSSVKIDMKLDRKMAAKR